MDSRRGERSISSSLDSALGPSDLDGVLGAEALKLGLVGDAAAAMPSADFLGRRADPLGHGSMFRAQPILLKSQMDTWGL